jgi:hypothetical protein
MSRAMSTKRFRPAFQSTEVRVGLYPVRSIYRDL